MTEKTQPRPRFPEGVKPDPATLAAGRYGTADMVQIWGPERTFDYSLEVVAKRSETLSTLYPGIVPPAVAREMVEKASTKVIDPNRIREIEEKTGHDVIAITRALEERLSEDAKPHCGEISTSADTTQPARALQLKRSLEVIACSVENLRDIVIEKSLEWIDVPHMDCTHGYDALPTVAGRPLAYYAEMLQSGLEVLAFVYKHSIRGKWGDATGNHHSATSLGVDGIKLQKKFCRRLGIRWMDAAAQVPGLEFEADVFYALTRLSATMDNLAEHIAWGRSDDVNIFINQSPQKKKGSSAMPHKDSKNGNPTTEEQGVSEENYMAGNLMTAIMNCRMPYARTLYASANARINLEDGFKFMDHAIRSMASTVYWIGLNEMRCEERVKRSYGVVTAQQVMNHLTNPRKTEFPMARSTAHDLMGRLATEAWESQVPFSNVLQRSEDVLFRIPLATLVTITDPLEYIGQSKEIVRMVAEKYHRRKTLA